MGDVRLKQQITEVLTAYHPFWLRLGLEVVVGKAVPPADGSASRLYRSRAELEAFAREHFLNDADLALQRAGTNWALGTLHERCLLGTALPLALRSLQAQLTLPLRSVMTRSARIKADSYI